MDIAERLEPKHLEAKQLEALKATLRHAIKIDAEPSKDSGHRFFFRDWHRRQGQAYFVLFAKNLRVTNIQYAELAALLRQHTRTDAKKNGPPPDLSIHSTDKFRKAIELLLRDFRHEETAVDLMTELYFPLLSRGVVIEPLYGSCALYFPPGLSLSPSGLCGESGYIHSIGHLVYLRKAYKASAEEFEGKFTEYFDREKPTDTRPRRLMAYSHETFDEKDRRMLGEIQDGLDDVKLYETKNFFGGKPISEVIAMVLKNHPEKLVGSNKDGGRVAADFTDSPPESHDPRSTFFLLGDYMVDPLMRKSATRYYVCYEQLFVNKNPWHVLDENKPAWLEPTTIPHRLMGAMINITRPWKEEPPPTVCDPFAGSGTTIFELQKLAGCVAVGSDKDPMSPQLYADNLELLGLTAQEILDLDLKITAMSKDVPRPRHQPVCYDIFSEYSNFKGTTHERNKQLAAMLENKKSLRDRYQFYVLRKTDRRHSIALDHDKAQWGSALQRESEGLAYGLREFGRVIGEKSVDDQVLGPLRLIVDSFSLGVTFRLHGSQESSGTVSEGDVLELAPSSCDVLVTDPPYGFNVPGETPVPLAKLYAEMIPALIRALRPAGQLVLALPAWSHNGQHFPYFVQAEVVTEQILAAAEAQNRRAYSEMRVFPSRVFRGPIYWESGKALRRQVLHFSFS